MNICDYFYHDQSRKIVLSKQQLLKFRSDNVMNGEFKLMVKGELYEIKSKSVGLGQYQVWLENTYDSARNL